MTGRLRYSLVLASIGAYLLLLAVSYVVRSSPPKTLLADVSTPAVTVRVVDGDELTERPVRIAYRLSLPPGGAAASAIVLLHGSPGQKDDFARVAPLLAQRHVVLVPDLPGFGASTRELPDYSFRAHARYLQQLLDQLAIPRVHVVGYSMGGGVALSFADLARDRLASLAMVSGIGVQEMELTGDYYVNHAIHGVQLAALWLLREGTPHMGRFDDVMLSVEYARNFYDSDQRPLRGILHGIAVPTLILHGVRDQQVPIEAAREHARLVPQSELYEHDSDHLALFRSEVDLGTAIADFVDRVDRGRARTRTEADRERVRVATARFPGDSLPPVRGIGAATFALLLGVLALVSSSAGAAVAGGLISQGRIGVSFGVTVCLGAAGVTGVWRYLRAARSPGAAGHRAASRAMASGGVALAWTIVAIGLAAIAAPWISVATSGLWRSPYARWTAAFVVMSCGLTLIRRGWTGMGRRRLLSSWRRLTRWEFWPPWAFYPPVVLYIAYLMAKHRSVTLFTAVNPAIEASGFIGESKHAILEGLAGAGTYVAQSRVIPATASTREKVRRATTFMASEQLSFPVVLKPDAGQRGSGVLVIRSAEALEARLAQTTVDTLIQEHVAGPEFGVFYYRRPSEARGHVFSVTEKRFPAVTGDGRRTLEELILYDDRAVCAARMYCDRFRDRLAEIPGAGESVRLAELGSHCRGAVFLDGRWAVTPALEERFDDIAHRFPGFHFGRFDVRVDGGIDEFLHGRGFKVIELNGVTSEATHIYHPGTPLHRAYRVLMEQWWLAFEIAAENRRLGVEITPISGLIRLARDYRRSARGHLS